MHVSLGRGPLFTTNESSLAAAALTLLCLAFGAAADAQTQPPSGRLFEQLDSNDDDAIDKGELESARRTAFGRADANSDDYVTAEEAKALRDELQSAIESSGRGGLRRGRSGQSDNPDAAKERLSAFDADGDGRISEKEFLDAPYPLLDRFDGDDDGRLTRAEMDAAREQIREEVRRRRGL